METLGEFPEGILRQVFELLGPRDAAALSSTCARLYALSKEDDWWTGAVKKLGHYGTDCEEGCRLDRIKQVYASMTDIRNGNWGEGVRKRMVLNGHVSVRQDDSMTVACGNFLPVNTITETNAVAVVGDLQKLILLGSNGRIVHCLIPQFVLPTPSVPYPLNPMDVLHLLSFLRDTVQDRKPEAIVCSLRQLFLDFRQEVYNGEWKMGYVHEKRISEMELQPHMAIASVKGLNQEGFKALKRISEMGVFLDFLDISDSIGDDLDIVGLMSRMKNASTFIARNTKFGSTSALMLGKGSFMLGHQLKHLDLSGCPRLKEEGCLTLLKEALSRLSKLKSLSLSNTQTGSLFSKTESSKLAPTFAQLEFLDISHISNLYPKNLGLILGICKHLKTLMCNGCTGLGEGGEESVIETLLVDCGAGSPRSSTLALYLPELRHLACGWGVGCRLLKSVFEKCSTLVSLSCSIGTVISDAVLEKLAECCWFLERLSLDSCCVSEKGVSKILQHCTRLRSLMLVHCVGPFSDWMSDQTESRACLEELCIIWGMQDLTDTGIKKLIGEKTASLKRLELVGNRCLTDALLTFLHIHSTTLHTLRLEECRRLGICNGQPEHPSSLPCFSHTAMEQLIQACLNLTRLRLRHSCDLDSNFVKTVVESCPIVHDVMVDLCDYMDKKVELVGVPAFRKIRYVQIAQCTKTPGVGQGLLDDKVTVLDLITKTQKVVKPELVRPQL